MTIMDIMDEVSRQYDVDSHSIIGCLKRVIRDEFHLGELLDIYENEKLSLYEEYVGKNNQKKRRRLKITQKKLNYIRDRLYRCVISESNNERLKNIKSLIGKEKVLVGEIASKNNYGFEIHTKFGKAFAPFGLLNSVELEGGRYQIGTRLNFHIHKIGIKKDRLNIVLDRVSKSLTKHIIKEILGDEYTIYTLQRMFGKRTKIYLNRQPTEEEVELLTMSLNEKIIFRLI